MDSEEEVDVEDVLLEEGDGLQTVSTEEVELIRELPNPPADEANAGDSLEQRYQKLLGRSYFELLGVGPQASKQEVEAAFERVATVHDPERVSPGGVPYQQRLWAEKTYLLFKRAYLTLLHPEAKAQYAQKIGLRDPSEEAAPFRAEESFDIGLEKMAQGEWQPAHEYFERAIRLRPSEGEYWAHLGWARYQLAPDSSDGRKKAMDYLDRAKKLSPAEAAIYWFRGQILEASNQTEAAKTEFERARACDPDFEPVLVKLREYRPAEEKRSRFFSRRS